MNTEWSYADTLASYKEGWSIFDADGQLEIQRLDDPSAAIPGGPSDPVFESDVAAIAFVKERAVAGSDLHIRALLLIGGAPTT